jgi:hypothetical protein
MSSIFVTFICDEFPLFFDAKKLNQEFGRCWAEEKNKITIRMINHWSRFKRHAISLLTFRMCYHARSTFFIIGIVRMICKTKFINSRMVTNEKEREQCDNFTKLNLNKLYSMKAKGFNVVKIQPTKFNYHIIFGSSQLLWKNLENEKRNLIYIPHWKATWNKLRAMMIV